MIRDPATWLDLVTASMVIIHVLAAHGAYSGFRFNPQLASRDGFWLTVQWPQSHLRRGGGSHFCSQKSPRAVLRI